MKTWFAAICLAIAVTVCAALEPEEVCLLKTEPVQYHANMGFYSALSEVDFGKASYSFQDIDVRAAKDVPFSYDLVTNPITVSVLGSVASAGSSLDGSVLAKVALQIPGGADALAITFNYDAASKNLFVAATDACGSAITNKMIQELGYDMPTATSALKWKWTFSIVNKGAGERATFNLKVDSDSALTKEIDASVELDESCWKSLDSLKDHLLVKINLFEQDMVNLVFGTGETDPKVDGVLMHPDDKFSPIVDYAHLQKVARFMAETEMMEPTSAIVRSHECYDISQYDGSEWTTAGSGETECPDTASPKYYEQSCLMPIQGDTATSCIQDNMYCQTCNSKCVAVSKANCDGTTIVQNTEDTIDIYVGGVKINDIDTDDHKVLLGDAYTFSCTTSDEMITYPEQKNLQYSDDRTAVHVPCLMNADGKVTNLDPIRLACKSKCTDFKASPEGSTIMDIDLADNYPEGYPVTFTCNEGYSDQNGGNEPGTDTCKKDGTSAIKCYRCQLPPLESGVLYDEEVETIKITEKVTIKCPYGYSLRFDNDKLDDTMELSCTYDGNGGTDLKDNRNTVFDASKWECVDPGTVGDCKLPFYIKHGYRVSLDDTDADDNFDTAKYECYYPYIMSPNKDSIENKRSSGVSLVDAYKELYGKGVCDANGKSYLPECLEPEEAGHCGLPTEIENGKVKDFIPNADDDEAMPVKAEYECNTGSSMYDTILGTTGFCRDDGSMELPRCETNADYNNMKFKLQNGRMKKLQRSDGKVFGGIVLSMGVNHENVEVGTWDYTCDDGINDYAAGAVCRSLDFKSGIVIPASKRMMLSKHEFGWTRVRCKYDDTLMTSHNCEAMPYKEAVKEMGLKEGSCFHGLDIAAVMCFDDKWKFDMEVKLFRKKIACLAQFFKEGKRINLQEMGDVKAKFYLDDKEIEVGDVKYKAKKGFFAKVNVKDKEFKCASCKIFVGEALLGQTQSCLRSN